MLPNDASAPGPGGGLPLLMAADLQDNLMTATNDLDRLQSLLTDACDALSHNFFGASAVVDLMQQADAGQSLIEPVQRMRGHLGGAITALQFQDMASQLIAHTHRRLRNCADRLARDTFADDEDGTAIVEEEPLKPNPVTQDEMDAGSVDLF